MSINSPVGPSYTSRPSWIMITRLGHRLDLLQNVRRKQNRLLLGDPQHRLADFAIWFGSRPAVGSSMISTSGSCSSAWAMPTRCRKPFESLLIGLSITLPRAHRSMTAPIRSLR